MTHARAGKRLLLTRRGRLARAALVLSVGVFGTVALLGSGDGPADAVDGPAVVSTSAAVSSEAISVPKAVVGFGDSVPSGAGCHCTNFVSAYAKRLAGGTTVTNYAEGGSTSADALGRLRESGVAAKVRNASTVLIMTGANDFVDPFSDVTDGADPDDSYAPTAKQVRTNVTAEIKQIHQLNPRVHVVVLDYWAAMEDGAVAQKNYDAAERRAATLATTYLNDALAAAAKAADATYVSTLTAFKGKDGRTDPTPLLESDGDHPNAAGHKKIADAITAALPRG
jgi:lysophospholipase L1-like esterase